MKYKKNDEKMKRQQQSASRNDGDILNFTTTPAQKNSVVREQLKNITKQFKEDKLHQVVKTHHQNYKPIELEQIY